MWQLKKHVSIKIKQSSKYTTNKKEFRSCICNWIKLKNLEEAKKYKMVAIVKDHGKWNITDNILLLFIVYIFIKTSFLFELYSCFST